MIWSLLEEWVPTKPEGVVQYQDLITYVTNGPDNDVRN